MKNWAASVKDRLRNISQKTGENFQEVCRQYAQEKFLARLAESKYSESFILKGGILFYVWTGNKYRPTKDLDFTYYGDFGFVKSNIIDIISSVWGKDIPDEGLTFNNDSIKVKEIKKGYNGISVSFICLIDKIRIVMMVDICTGDAVTPHTRELEFPSLLDEARILLKTYPIESVFAEKVQAMVDLGLGNSRMKDFSDVYFIATELAAEFKCSEDNLKQALKTTFFNRGLVPPNPPVDVWTEYFYDNSSKLTQWNAMIRRTKNFDLSLKEVCEVIAGFTNPLFKDITDQMKIALAKKAISMEFHQPVEIIEVENFDNNQINLAYIKEEDQKHFKYIVRYEEDRIIWAGADLFKAGGIGRWRNGPDDSRITFKLIKGKLWVRRIFSDGSGDEDCVDF